MKNIILETYGTDPTALFALWLKEAEGKEISDPNAMALATAEAGGRPSVRIILMKSFDARGLTFFTNRQSRKGRELGANPYAEANFYWKSLGRQVRLSGRIEQTTDAEADEYFATRSRPSQLGACASDQSRPLKSYETFEQRVQELEKQYKGRPVPRPAYWGGYRLIPDSMEFWIGHADRLHKRFVYVLRNKIWEAEWLYP